MDDGGVEGALDELVHPAGGLGDAVGFVAGDGDELRADGFTLGLGSVTPASLARKRVGGVDGDEA